MRPDVKKYLYDIDQAAGLIAQFTKGKGFPDYQADPMLRSAVERQFEIVGEAMTQLARLGTSWRMDTHRLTTGLCGMSWSRSFRCSDRR